MGPNDIFALSLTAAVLIAAVATFVHVARRLRKGGGSLTTTVLGATDEFLTTDRKRAAETIVNENAGKKFVSQSSAQPVGDKGSGPSPGGAE